jgi:hypothetical protein
VTRIVWCTHPRHLPKVPGGRSVMLDVAFAAGGQWKSKTKVFIDALGPRLVRFVDHHEHKEAWRHYKGDPRFLLVPNKIAHACPELITPELVRAAGPIDDIVAHADFDGALAAVKWLRGGKEPWPGADEDARAVDSPGRGHTLSEIGARYALAMDEASARYERDRQLKLLSAIATAMADGAADPALDDELDQLGEGARAAEAEARLLADRCGAHEAPGLFVVRLDHKPDNRTRRNLLLFAEERARVGAIIEPDPAGGAWIIAATFDEELDLEKVDGFEGGRSDYRFARAHQGGAALLEGLARYVGSVPRAAAGEG